MQASRRFSKLIVWFVAIPLATVVAFFAIANRQAVTLDFWPLPFDMTMPLFIILIATVIFGFLLGALVHWIIAGRLRLRARRAEKRAEAAEQELARLRDQGNGPGGAPGSEQRGLSRAA